MMRVKREGGGRGWRLAVVALVASIAVVGLGGPVSQAATQAPGGRGAVAQSTSVSDHFSGPGPWGAVLSGSADVPAAGGLRFWYPEHLGAFGADHPVLTWGNGTGASTDTYTDLIEHLAAWGFVVVASNSTVTGSGDEMLAAAEWMVDQNDNPGSVFHQKLATDRVGALGQSQGAGGAINATISSDGLITSTLPIALPDVGWWDPELTPDDAEELVAQLEHPVFFMYGEIDPVTIWDQELWFNAAGGPALTAARDGLHHGIGGNDGECTIVFFWEFCGQASPILGYATAWFVYTLADDEFARGAFVGPDGGPGEIMTDDNWSRKNPRDLP